VSTRSRRCHTTRAPARRGAIEPQIPDFSELVWTMSGQLAQTPGQRECIAERVVESTEWESPGAQVLLSQQPSPLIQHQHLDRDARVAQAIYLAGRLRRGSRAPRRRGAPAGGAAAQAPLLRARPCGPSRRHEARAWEDRDHRSRETSTPARRPAIPIETGLDAPLSAERRQCVTSHSRTGQRRPDRNRCMPGHVGRSGVTGAVVAGPF
jgi:hypothetical protein